MGILSGTWRKFLPALPNSPPPYSSLNTERATGAENGNTGVCGIIPLTLMDIFAGMKQKQAEATLPEEKWSLSVSYLEVYNEKIRDLLEPSGINLPVQEDPKAGIVGVGGLAAKSAESSEQVMELLRFGNTNRRTHATDANATSSRSHAVLQIIMKQRWNNSKGREVTRESRVNLIDLAGSERAGKTNNRGKRLQEGGEWTCGREGKSERSEGTTSFIPTITITIM